MWGSIPQPWDHDLSQNQESTTKLTEPPRHLCTKFFKVPPPPPSSFHYHCHPCVGRAPRGPWGKSQPIYKCPFSFHHNRPDILQLAFYLKKIFFFNVYLFLRQRETQHEQGRGRERGKHRIWSRLQALSCQHRARRGARAHGWQDRDLSRSWPLNRLSHPGTPRARLSMRAMTKNFAAIF